jgi:hypothetical protein
MSETNNNNGSRFEKAALTVLAAVIVLILGGIGKTVNENQLQYTEIKANQVNQTIILVDMQTKFNDSVKWRSTIESRLALLEQHNKYQEKH